MADAGLRKLFTQMRKLPSVPTVYFRLLELLMSQDTSSEMVGEIIAEDPGLTIRVLQMVNSPLFGIGRTISSAAEAVGYLGLQRTQSLVLVSQAFSAGSTGPGASEIDRLWRHSLLTGDFAQRIARAASRETRVADESYTAGVLHDVGKLMLAANLPEEYEAIRRTHRETRRPLQTVEKEVLGASHAEVGACALTIWGLPSPIVEAIAYHHHPEKNKSRMFTPTIAVHAANAIAHELQPDVNAPAVDKLDEIHLADLGLASQVAHWREICQRPPPAEG
jgi:putative nucleotidyltransferase with HDIG domain